jgi:O-antigen/teichoic acid export membrane protein
LEHPNLSAGKKAQGGLRARVISSSIWTLGNSGGTMVLRLASNLLITRLLFPEAFGMMAIVQVFIAGLQQFSDAGIQASIVQNKRGDDVDFLDTAWTLQIIRGGMLWLGACALATPVARIYEEPLLAQLLPVNALLLLLTGLAPTAAILADRHLMQARVVTITLVSQLGTILIMATLAYTLRSVWALALGAVAGQALKTALLWIFLPNAKNRFRLERHAMREMFHFGKYIFLSTAAGFIMQQGDRAVLGLFIPVGLLGIYNIAFFMANVPLVLSRVLGSKVIFPLQCKKPPTESAANQASLFRVRRLLALGLMGAAAVLAFIGPALVDLLYDPRYAAAGPMMTLYCLSVVPTIGLNGFAPAMLAAGDSRRLLIAQASTAAIQLLLLFVGARYAGVFGATLASGGAMLITAPLRILFLRKYKAWDPVQGIGIMLLGLVLCGAACALHWPDIWALRITTGQ